MNGYRLTHYGNRIYKPIRKLGAQHWRNGLAGAIERFSKGISCIATRRSHVAGLATVGRRISKPVTAEELKKLWHRENGSAGQHKNT